MNTAQQLLRGSRNIDQMERDVNELTNMLLGLLKRQSVISTNHKEKTFHFKGKTVKWILQVEGSNNSIALTCHVDYVTVYSSLYGKDYFHGHTKEIQDVYEGLPVLVEGLKTTFPELEKYLKVFLRASAV